MHNSIPYGFCMFSAFFGLCHASGTGTQPVLTGWTWGNGGRSTFDILWSCLSIIVICTWKVVHLNVPSQEEADASWRQLLFWRKWLRKAKWMGMMALSPEILFSMAIRDWLWSRASLKEFEKLSLRNPYAARRFLYSQATDSVVHVDSMESYRTLKRAENLSKYRPVRWTIVHAHYANMGGFRIRFPREDVAETVTKNNTFSSVEVQDTHVSTPRAYPSFPLSADELLELVENFSLEVPYIHRRNIEDRSKSDLLTKAFAIGQSIWLIVQSVARAAQGLPITELELATMGFVGCALVLYLLWWNKPFDVEHSVPIDCPPQDREKVLAKLHTMFEARYTSKFLSPRWEDFYKERRIRNWAYMNDLGLGRPTWLIGTLSLMFIGMAFSGLHISAWNWSFPTHTELYLWRTASLAATVALLPIAVLLPLLGTGRKPWQHMLVKMFVGPLCGLYVCARITLMVQVLICFRAMPEEVYQNVAWTYFLPRFT